MGKPKQGIKHTCSNCEARFYDLGNNPVMCPKCGAEIVLEMTKKSLAALKEAEETTSETEETENEAEDEITIDDIEVEDDDDEDLDEDEDQGLIEDTSSLGGDDEDGISEVREHVDNGVKDG